MDFQMMCKLLKNLLDLSEYHWKEAKDLSDSNLRTGSTMRNYEQMNYKIKALTPQGLGSSIQKSRNSHLLLSRFYLPPLDENREFIPILSLDCKFASSPPFWVCEWEWPSIPMRAKVSLWAWDSDLRRVNMLQTTTTLICSLLANHIRARTKVWMDVLSYLKSIHALSHLQRILFLSFFACCSAFTAAGYSRKGFFLLKLVASGWTPRAFFYDVPIMRTGFMMES